MSMADESRDREEVDRVVPGDKWAFDDEVTRVFENMLRRSIPQYDVMRDAVTNVGRHFVRDGAAVVDIGCSRGDALAPFVELATSLRPCVGVDVSGPMVAEARARFAPAIAAGRVAIGELDLRSAYPAWSASLTLAVLTLQFTPIEYRARILADAYAHTVPGGAIILVEKVLGGTAQADGILVEEYYRLKEGNGYSADDIARKRLSLEGVLVPVTAKWNEELLRAAGFGGVECFWRWMNFAAWVAVRG